MVWQGLVVAEPGEPNRALLQELAAVEPRLRFRVVAPGEAVAAAAEYDPDLVLVRLAAHPDRLLRVLDELHRQRPERALLAEVPAEHPLVAVQAFSVGATDCLKAPVAPWEWQHRVRLHLERHRQHRLLERMVARSRRHSGRREEVGRVLELLARIDASRDALTGAHERRTARLAGLLGSALGLSAGECRRLEAGAVLHDIGKIGIPEPVLRKPGRYTEAECGVMREHARIGHEILTAAGQSHLRLGAAIARSHHERFDGSGYPDGLAGQGIPLEARVVAVADVFDSITARRPYKAADTVEAGMAVLARGAGRQFDPECVRAFAARRGEVHRLVAADGEPDRAQGADCL